MRKLIFPLLLVFLCQGCASLETKKPVKGAEALDLSGIWQSSLGECRLPGTTDENRLGSGEHPTNVTSQLTRLYPYKGVVSYERDIEITKEMAGKELTLYLERTKITQVWVDGDSLTYRLTNILSPQEYELAPLSAGKHHLRIDVDNRDEAVPSGVHGSHAWSDATQTNWNGILGKMELRTQAASVSVGNVKVYPDVQKREVKVVVDFSAKRGKYTVDLSVHEAAHPEKQVCAQTAQMVNKSEGLAQMTFVLPMGEEVKLWSEFHPDLYTLELSVTGKQERDERSVTFGMVQYATEGTRFKVNDHYTFMRGTHDACVFPLTAYCPTDKEEWLRTFRIAKEYGINHYRFHSYTPTEAAFEAADELGIYLHSELPMWGTLDTTTVEINQYLRNEAFRILAAFGNHPSFMGFGLGNELWGDNQMMGRWLDEFRAFDSRHLYNQGSNNDLGWRGPKEGEDFYTTCRVGGGEGFTTHARTSFSFADADNGGILNTNRPNAKADFSHVVGLCKVPIVSHETCQFQIYPDYTELPKYTGVLYPYNLEIFRDRLKENGLSEQASDFHRATGEWAVACYKADMEYCMRTPGFGGYQLLDIKDYPGQGSALCGILDAFMETKGVVEPETFSEWNAPVVPFALLDSYCWRSTDSLTFEVALCNYTEETIAPAVVCSLVGGKESYLEQTRLEECRVENGQVRRVGRCSFPLQEIKESTMLELTLYANCEGAPYRNHYKIWVYAPENESGRDVIADEEVLRADTLDALVIAALQRGRRVLLTPRLSSIESNSVGGLFTPDYWNYAMFKSISESVNKPVSPGTLGMLMEAEHPALAGFPNEGCSDWPWWSIALHSRPLILNRLPKEYFPIIQTVDNVERNHKLGILMEFAVGEGRLLISTTDLQAISAYPEGAAYAASIVRYAASKSFQPMEEISVGELRSLLYGEEQVRDIQGVKNITDYKQEGH